VDPIEIYDRGRGPELKRIRITVYDIIPYLEEGWDPSWIPTVLPITTAEVMALIKYIEEHKEEVMAVHRKIEERIARGNPPEIRAKFRASHAKLLALKAELKRKRQPEANGASDPERH
jgi:uncharacterized protein (DUF433 family)